MSGEYDAVVVGSGFGGGITACRLAQAGWRVCVLERGRRFGRADFISAPSDVLKLPWHDTLNPDGIFDVRLFKDIVVITAAGVGGGSLLYANVQLRARPDLFDAGWPAEITRAALDPYYERIESVLQPVPAPADHAIPRRDAFRAMARAAGEQAVDLPIAVHFGEDRVNPFSGVPQSGCGYLARCDIGCPLHAKNTIDITYVARAEREGADVRTHCEVVRIDPPSAPGNGRPAGWRVGYRGLGDTDDGEVTAPVLVLSAGTLGSTRLLLKNRRRLRNLSAALGTRFSGNGDALGAAFDPSRPGVAGARSDYGPVMSAMIDYWDRDRFIVADGTLPPRFTDLLRVLRGEAELVGWRKHLLFRLRWLAFLLGLSDRLVAPKDVKLDLDDTAIDQSLVFLMLGKDAADGRMRLTRLFRRLEVDWSTAASMPLIDAMRCAATKLGEAAQAEPFFALGTGPFGRDITVHPLGGCPMADDPAAGVVDQFGRVHGHRGLYVCDGSIVPTAIGVNPSETIGALAERNAEAIVADGAR